MEPVRRLLYEGKLAIALRSALIAALLVLAKWGVHVLGYDAVVTLNLLTAILGGVIFTLAIMLSGVFSDFKESERLVSETATTLRRLHADLAVIARGDRLDAMRRELAAAAGALNADLRAGHAIQMRRVLAPVERLDAMLVEVSRQADAPSSNVRTVQVGLGTFTRCVDRLENIVETAFLRAGYAFAAFCVAGALAALTFTRLEPLGQGLALHALASFVLVGLFILVRDLDNPFYGAVRASIKQLEKVEETLRVAPARPTLVPAAPAS